MAIDRCAEGHVFDRDWNTECPRCLMAAMKAPVKVEITDDRTALIRILKDETNNRDVFGRCKRVLGEV